MKFEQIAQKIATNYLKVGDTVEFLKSGFFLKTNLPMKISQILNNSLIIEEIEEIGGANSFRNKDFQYPANLFRKIEQ